MIKEAVAESVIGLCIEAAKARSQKNLDEKKLRDALSDYIERQRKYNEMCSLAEEIDFQGLVEYISQNLIADVGVRIFDPNPKTRGMARNTIVNTAIAHSKARTPEAKNRVKRCTATCLDIISDFYKEHHISIRDYLIADSIVDAVGDKIEDETKAIVSAVQAESKKLQKNLGNNGSLFSLDTAVSLAKNGRIDEVGTGIKEILDHTSLLHPYYPSFGYDYIDGKMHSKPLTAEAATHYPPGIRLAGSIRIGDKSVSELKCDVLDYSYRHQAPIIVEVTEAVKLLGEKPDPIQHEAEDLIGKTVIAKPPEFPPAFPCALKVGDTSFYDYVLFRTQEVYDDGTYFISNKEQDIPLLFEVKFHPEKLGHPGFSIRARRGLTSKEHLKYLRFLKALSGEKSFRIYVLSARNDLLSCTIDTVDRVSGFSSIDEEIDFWTRVCEVEEYYNVTLAPKGDISRDEYDLLIHISELIRNDEVHSTWEKVTFNCIIDQRFRQNLISMDKELNRLAYVGVSHINIFGAKFVIRLARVLKCAHVSDFEKIKKKIEVLDDGDEIKLTLHSGKDKDVYDTLNIPDHITEQEGTI